VTPARSADENLRTTALAGNVPAGLTGFDRLPRTATPMQLLLLVGTLLLLAAASLGFMHKRHAGA